MLMMGLLLDKMFNIKKEPMNLIFIIQAHEGETPQMQLQDVCTIELKCKSGDDALKKAKKLIKKKHYRISQIIEKESKCQK